MKFEKYEEKFRPVLVWPKYPNSDNFVQLRKMSKLYKSACFSKYPVYRWAQNLQCMNHVTQKRKTFYDTKKLKNIIIIN